MTIGRLGDLNASDDYVNSLLRDSDRIIGIDPSLNGCGVSCIDSDGVLNTWIHTESSIPAYYRILGIKDVILNVYGDRLKDASFFVMEAAVTGGWSSPLMFALSVSLLGMCSELNKPVLLIHVSKLRAFVNYVFNLPKRYEPLIKDVFLGCGYSFMKKMGTDCIDAMLLASIYSKYAGDVFPDYYSKWNPVLFRSYLEPLKQYVFIPKYDFKVVKKDFNGVVDVKIT